MFETGTDRPSPLLVELARLVASVRVLVENEIAVEGHTAAEPVVLLENPVWELSTARANRMRRMLETDGSGTGRMRRVTGHADREPPWS